MVRNVWEHRADYAYVLPAIVVMLIVIAYPIYYTADLSFFMTPPGLQLRDKTFVGFDNYVQLFADTRFWNSFLRVLIFLAVQVPIMHVFGQ